MEFQNPLSNLIGDLFSEWLANKVDAALIALNNVLPDVATLFIIFCGICMMVTGKPGKWFSRAMIGLWVSIVMIIM